MNLYLYSTTSVWSGA